MLKGYRRRFVMLNMILVGSVLLATFISIGIAVYRDDYAELKSTMSMVVKPLNAPERNSDNKKTPPEKRDGENKSPPQREQKNNQPKRDNDDNITTIFYDSKNDEISILSETLSFDGDTEEIVHEIAKQKDNFGILDNYHVIYYKDKTQNEYKIAVTDISYISSQIIKIILILLTAYVLSMGVVFFISVQLSKLAAKPMENAIEMERKFVADISHDLKTPITIILANNSIINGGTYKVTAVNNGIAADGSVTINGGNFNIYTDNDGIKSVPDTDDTVSTGSVTINGGTFNITADGDGISAEDTLKITNGDFTIKTMNGYNDSSFNSDTMSCKGLKASGDRENIENNLIITGGTFNINTADDALHSDTNAEITGGTFKIYTGDDGVHADTQLDLGISGGLARDPEFYIYSCYEGLESGTLNMYSGKYYIVASDDGINAASGSSNGSDPGQGGGNTFRPGGRPGQNNPGGNPGGSSSTGNYSLNIYGGSVYVNALGDGLDSNGALNMTGGNITVFSQARGGDNSPLDCDGTMTLNGATVFAAGTNPMNENPSTSTSQSYYKQTTSLSANTVVNVKNGSTILYSDKLLRNINYLLYSNPNVSSSSISISTGGSVDNCNSHAFTHNWNSGKVVTAATATSTGKMLYTCQDCGVTEYKTVPMTVSENCDGHDDTLVVADEGYAVAFSTDSGATVNVYDTQDYTTASITNAKTTVSRNSNTGLPDSTGEGQVNFRVILKSGYELDSVTVTGGYKNLKDVSTDTLSNLYRLTKVTSDLTITVKTKSSATALENNSTLSSTNITLGSSVTANAKATGGTGTYTYAVYYKQTSQTSWTTAQNFGTNATVTFKPAKAVTYDVCVKVKDSSGTIEKKYFTVTVTSNTLVNNSTLSAANVVLGTKITATGKASGGTGTYKYAVYYKQTSQTKWTTAQDFNTNASVTFKPAKATTYDVCVKVKDSDGTIAKKYFTLTVSK